MLAEPLVVWSVPMLNLFVATLVLAAAPAADFKALAPEGAPFTLSVPADWEVDHGVVMTVASPFETAADKFRENLKVAVAPLAAGTTAEQYIQRSKEAYQAIWTVHEQKATTLAGVPATFMLLNQKVGPVETRLVKYFLVHDGQMLVLTGAAEPKVFDRYRPTFERIVGSLQLKPPAAAVPGAAVKGKGYSVVPLPGWRVIGTQGGELLAIKREGEDGVSVLGTRQKTTLNAALTGVRGLYDDGELGRITADTAYTLGGSPGRKLVVVYEDEEGGDTLVRYLGEKGGHVVELRFKVDLAKPPAALLAEFDAIAASFRWE